MLLSCLNLCLREFLSSLLHGETPILLIRPTFTPTDTFPCQLVFQLVLVSPIGCLCPCARLQAFCQNLCSGVQLQVIIKTLFIKSSKLRQLAETLSVLVKCFFVVRLKVTNPAFNTYSMRLCFIELVHTRKEFFLLIFDYFTSLTQLIGLCVNVVSRHVRFLKRNLVA